MREMFKLKRSLAAMVALLLLVGLISGWGARGPLVLAQSGKGSTVSTQEEAQATEQFKVLIVDETRTFSSTIRLQVLASLLKKTGRFTLTAKFVQVDSSFADPLQGEEPDGRYDIILIIPKGVDDGTLKQLWVLTRPFTEISQELRDAVAQLEGITNKVFQDAAMAVDVTDDLIPGYFAALFIKEGWL